jgi:hypothetical protein
MKGTTPQSLSSLPYLFSYRDKAAAAPVLVPPPTRHRARAAAADTANGLHYHHHDAFSFVCQCRKCAGVLSARAQRNHARRTDLEAAQAGPPAGRTQQVEASAAAH